MSLEEVTYVLGPNGSGKTAVLEALSRMFSPIPAQRRVRLTDFHVPLGGRIDEEAMLWVEAHFEIAEASEEAPNPAVPPFFAHMALGEPGGAPQLRVRLTATLEPDGNVDERIEYVLEADDDGDPVRVSAMSRRVTFTVAPIFLR